MRTTEESEGTGSAERAVFQATEKETPQSVEDRVFLREGSVTVTKTRFIVPSQTYAMSGITSVSSTMEAPKRWKSLLLVLAGVGLLPNIETIGLGLILLIIAAML